MTAGLLSRPTLVLNRNWQPVGIATVSRTLVKLWNGTARVVDPHDYQIYSWSDWALQQPVDDEPYIQTSSLRLRVPEVITLTKYDRVPNRSVATLTSSRIMAGVGGAPVAGLGAAGVAVAAHADAGWSPFR